MRFQFTNPEWLFSLIPALLITFWLAWRSHVQTARWRRGASLGLRCLMVACLGLAIAGLQAMKRIEGVNLLYLLDRSDSVPSSQQEAAREFVGRNLSQRPASDKAGVLVFASEAAIEATPGPATRLEKILAVIGTERTDIASAIRLGTAAFPETGQKRLVLVSDGNENSGDALSAILSAAPLGVTLDVIPLGTIRAHDVSVRKLALPSSVKKGQTFEIEIFAESDAPVSGTVRLYRNERFYGERKMELSAGKNLLAFPETLTQPGFYSYNVEIEAPNDSLPQNNRASGFVHVRGDPRVLILSSDVAQDGALAAALRSGRLETEIRAVSSRPSSLAEIQSYDTVFLSNIAAGDLGEEWMTWMESAVRDFGVGLVCVGGDQAFAAGGYRGTPLEAALPVEMELNSKKVLPSGALVLVVHATEFPNGNQWARDIAFAALDALGPQDELGVVLWDGRDRWLFPLDKVGDKKSMGRMIAGMNPGDMPAFGNVMRMAHEGLAKSAAHLKHMVVFSDGDPGAPSPELIQAIVGDKITISTVMIGGHVMPDTMQWMAGQGGGRFYDVRSPGQLPQIFIKEAAVILKSAIFEEPFKPQAALATEVVRGISAGEYPQLRGYVCTTAKPRAEFPLLTDKGDPLLAHWHFGLGRAVAFTSDARSKWATAWLGWAKYRQFWTQVAQWSLRRVEQVDLTSEVSVEKGEGQLSVDAMDRQGNYRNFLSLQATVVGPKGERQIVALEQTAPGHYEAKFPARETGAYLINLSEMEGGRVRGSQVLGASVSYSPEFEDTAPNLHFLERLAAAGGGKVLNPRTDNPFLHERKRTYQPQDLWEWLLKLAILLFPIDVAVRRIQLDREEWRKATTSLRRWLFFWRGVPRPTGADESLAALLSRRDQVRERQRMETGTPVTVSRPDLFEPKSSPPEVDLDKGGSGEEAVPAVPGAAGQEKKEEGPASTTARLLEAKRRAGKKKE